MGDPISTLALASFAVVALSIASMAALKGWREWLALKRLELAHAPMRDMAPPSPASRSSSPTSDGVAQARGDCQRRRSLFLGQSHRFAGAAA